MPWFETPGNNDPITCILQGRRNIDETELPTTFHGQQSELPKTIEIDEEIAHLETARIEMSKVEKYIKERFAREVSSSSPGFIDSVLIEHDQGQARFQHLSRL